MDTRKILNQRQNTHGDFTDNARIAQSLIEVVRSEINYDTLTQIEKEAIEMILHKIARAISTQNYHGDNYADIAGYAQLVVDRLGE